MKMIKYTKNDKYTKNEKIYEINQNFVYNVSLYIPTSNKFSYIMFSLYIPTRNRLTKN